MRKASFCILVMGVVLSLNCAIAEAFKRIGVGEPAHDFVLETHTGQHHIQLMDSLGDKATVLVFWAAWSPRSEEALADFQALYADYGTGGLQVIAVNVEHDVWDPADMALIAQTIGKVGAAYPVVVDKDLSTFDRYGVIAVPSSLLLDGSGNVVEMLAGYSNMTRSDFREKILRILGVQAPETQKASTRAGEYSPKGKAERFCQMGKLFLKKKMALRAIGAFERAIEEDPNYVQAYRDLLEVFTSLGRREETERLQAKIASLENMF